MSAYAVVVLYCGLFGLVIGSFLNVVIVRLPRKESIVRPRSRCPGCGSQLAARDNVPVVSWLVLRGRCRSCGEPISSRYPLVELLTAAVFVALGARFGLDAALPAFLVLGAAGVAISAIDLEHRIVPTRLVYPCLAAALVLLAAAAALDGEWGHLMRAVIGAVFARTALWVIHVVQPRGMGFGDVRLATLLGLLLGWLSLGHVAVGLFLGFLAGAVVGSALLLSGRRGRKDALPFAPFLVLGTLLAVLWGSPLLAWYPTP
ncbi:MAG TPA: prepilin peptidase [Acidimicrobiales bacterium]|nr:prepilin peptidase [Acidimicrobiales bacterium]